MNASSESLPPPPAYLLDSTTGRTSPGKVGETVKALTELNHMPASPSVLRRNVNQISPTPPQVNRFYRNFNLIFISITHEFQSYTQKTHFPIIFFKIQNLKFPN